VRRYPQGFGRILAALEFYFNPTREIVLLGASDELKNEIWREYLPNKVVVLAEDADDSAEFIPLLRERTLLDGRPTAYVCENFACRRPVTSAEDLREQLGKSDRL
jgi:uncharacterized protein YyaL (SSP411 family)